MFNLIGNQIELIQTFSSNGWHVDDYGKVTHSKGRKVGHVTKIVEDEDELTEAIKFGLRQTT